MKKKEKDLSENAKNVKEIFTSVKYPVFGISLPLEKQQDMSELEEESDEQKGQELKILTPKQMITRLPILLAQVKAGNNSRK